MPFCIRCSPLACDGAGLISISVSINSSATPVDDDRCSISSGGGNVSPTESTDGKATESSDYIPGPVTGSITLQFYAFEAGQDEKWLGSRCKGQFNGSQSNIQRYDCRSSKWWILPSTNHKAQIAGDISEEYVSLETVFFSGKQASSRSVNGVTIGEEQEVFLGAKLSYKGAPFPVTIPSTKIYKINLLPNPLVGCILNSVSADVDYPNPAVISYTFEFPVTSEINNFITTK